MVSGSEVAFFSLSSSNDRLLDEEESVAASRIQNLIAKPKRLLATILIANNFVNIAIVIVTQLLINTLLPPESLENFGALVSENLLGGMISAGSLALATSFFLTVVVVTFILVLFGEVAPKIYANIDNLRFAKIMAGPLTLLNFLFTPLSSILVGWGNSIENRISSNRNYQTGSSKEDLDAAIELTVMNEEDSQQDLDILKGIINFGDLSAKQIMRPRVDVVAIEEETEYHEVLTILKDSGYSRIPVYDEELDNVKGILYVKDLLEFIGETKTFNWQKLVRTNTLFVPETKKIDDLLREFQSKRLHMAIVVDEYGGTQGIITLEDIMEEVIGDIKDEFDEEESINYIEIGKGNYIFEGKSLLHDVSKIIGEAPSYFDDIKGNSDSLGGIIIEHLGILPKEEQELKIKNIQLKIISVTNRRIEKINLKVNNP
jgi:gliding motility-associated protein GldE